MNIFRSIKLRIAKVRSITYTFWVSHFYHGIQVGKHTMIYYKSSVVNNAPEGAAIIGDNCVIGRPSIFYHAGMPFHTRLFVDGVRGKIFIGNNCHINGSCIHAKGKIEIGNDCVIAAGVSVIDSNGHEVKGDNRHIQDNPSPIIIGNNVWIGLNAIVLKGSTIGDNSVISAGSVVKGCFPANSIISGNPAKVVKIIEDKK